MSMEGRDTRKILITVKTYPTPSRQYGETVCVAGVDVHTGELIRLYPVTFRDLPDNARFRKYSVVEVAVRKHRSDPRPESYDPHWESIRVVDFIDSSDGWQTRWHLMRRALTASMCETIRRQEADGTSLGFFRPAVVDDFVVRRDAPDWSPSQKDAMAQLRLFGRQKKLEKVPLKFSYKYHCADPGCRGHHQRLLDWEVYEYYRRRVRRRSRSFEETQQLMRQRFFGGLCGPDRDTFFLVGNHSGHPASFMVLGVFWPPKQPSSLFD